MVDCKQCNGACCRWLKLDYGGRTREIDAWIKARGGVWKDGAYWLPHVCPMLSFGQTTTKDNDCLIYDKRPLACRVFHVGSPDCLTCRKLEGYTEGISDKSSP